MAKAEASCRRIGIDDPAGRATVAGNMQRRYVCGVRPAVRDLMDSLYRKATLGRDPCMGY